MTSPRPRDILVDHGFAPGADARHVEPFVRACDRGLDEVVTAYLDLGMSPNTRGEDDPALHAAAAAGHTSTVALLLDRGADIDTRDTADDTPLRTALNHDHLEVARLLVSRGADIEAAHSSGESALDHAIDKESDPCRDLLLELGADPNYRNAGRSPLRTAIAKGADAVAALLDAGASASLVLDLRGATPLHAAVHVQDPDVVALLLARGAAPDARDVHGLTPLDHALMFEDPDILAALSATHAPSPHQQARAELWQTIKRGETDEALAFLATHDISLDTRNEAHETLLMAFARAGHLTGVRRLLARGASPEAHNFSDNAASQAAAAGHDEVLAVLLAAGADPVDPTGMPAGVHDAIHGGHLAVVRRVLEACSPAQRARAAEHLHRAVIDRNVEMVALLAAMQVPLEHRDERGETPLMAAVSDEHDLYVARALLLGGADLHAASPTGHTPLHKLLAAHQWDSDHEPTLRLLLERGARLDALTSDGSTPWAGARDEAKEALIRELVTAPLARQTSVPALAARHSWATLAAVASADRGDLVLALIDAGVPVNPPHSHVFETVLHAAVDLQNPELVRGLLARGADVNLTARHESPLMIAARSESAEILTMLLDAGADPTWTTADGRHALHWAVDQPQHLPLLLARGARTDDLVHTPLLTAARERSVAATKHLLAHGARVDVRDERGRTPLCIAIGKGAVELTRLLLEAGASPTFMDRSDGETPLTAAAKRGSVPLIELLLTHGGNLDDRNQGGEDVRTLLQDHLDPEELRAFTDRLKPRGAG